MWTSLALTEIALLTATIWVGVYAYQRWGPGRMRGMATAAEAEKLLGVTRLRKVAGIVRPDLYGKHAAARSRCTAPPATPPNDPGPRSARGSAPGCSTAGSPSQREER